ncbi:hypothetical protein ACFQ1M_02960 [Sungkyunkwania multivorans]|uniref:Uncharacterized protein n=1 Tax=Sungkyunkwania multivorans TaxID=1173618 RepID=A0ABW3CTS2_9FLAO
MNNEHNPIAQLVTKIQQRWVDEVSPHEQLQLVRWLIKPDQARLYEGFLRLESTPNGSLPEVTIVLLTEFHSKEAHSKALIKDWVTYFKEDKTLQEALDSRILKFDWDVDVYENKLTSEDTDFDLLLLEMLNTFQKAMPNRQQGLTLALFPYSVAYPKEYNSWLNAITQQGLPKKARIMFFDHVEERYYDDVMDKQKDRAKTLSVTLDLQGAINKIAASGDPNDPEIQFRQCMIEMSKSVAKKNLSRLHEWGKKGLSVTQKTGSKSAMASAHVIYAGMLFNFKEYKTIETLLQRGMSLARQGLETGDDTCKPVIIQTYGYMASCKQLQKEKETASDLFCKQADISIEYGFGPQALTAWWLGYNVIKKRDKKKYKEIVATAYNFGVTIPPEMLKATCMPFIAADHFNISENDREKERCDTIHTFMVDVDGEEWRTKVEEHRKEMEKKSLSILNWF